VIHRALIALTLILSSASSASADWFMTPFLGSAFASQTPFIDPEQSEGSTQLVVGGSVAWLSSGVFGLEGDFGYAPRFFEQDNRAGLVSGSNMTTLVGNVMVTLPLSITRESLRPYLIGGAGLMHAAARTVGDVFTFNDNLFGYDVGGGAIGMFDPNVGVRFDLRQFRSVYALQHRVLPGTEHLSFWRATIGVTIRY
jgi:opacity protein-like surface antigen